jgi:hypothetical protein
LKVDKKTIFWTNLEGFLITNMNYYHFIKIFFYLFLNFLIIYEKIPIIFFKTKKPSSI